MFTLEELKELFNELEVQLDHQQYFIDNYNVKNEAYVNQVMDYLEQMQSTIAVELEQVDADLAQQETTIAQMIVDQPKD
jgi:fructose/tagatose bisphosphate aldolase